MEAAILGKKIGMTSFYRENGDRLSCTVVEAGPCPIVQIRTKDNDGYEAVQLGYGTISDKNLIKPMKGHFEKAGVEPTRRLKEFRDLRVKAAVGEELTVEQFKPGDKVSISGKNKGQGFQGVVKRHHFKGVGEMTHGQSDRQRHGGSVGQSAYPSRIFKGMKMPGRMGGKRTTISNVEVLDVIPERNLLLLKGGIPGHNDSLIEIVKK